MIDIMQLNQFRAFTRFADTAINVFGTKIGENKVASVDHYDDLVNKLELGGKGDAISISINKSDKPRAWTRTKENKDLNNETRKIFKDIIAKLFGGEKNIPQEVQDAMHIDTFRKNGRPLTARRINETKTAIIDYFNKSHNAGISTENMQAILAGTRNAEDFINVTSENNIIDTTHSIKDGDEPVKKSTKPVNTSKQVKGTGTNKANNLNQMKMPKVGGTRKNGTNKSSDKNEKIATGGKVRNNFKKLVGIFDKKNS